VRHELCAFDMGVKPFTEEAIKFLADKCAGFNIEQATGDPAGEAQDAHDETVFQIMKAAGLDCRPASSNEPSIRVGAVQDLLRKSIQGEPMLLIHPDCKMLRRACIDGYRYRKLKVAGERYDDKPDKNPWSHVAEALQYLLLGGGEGKALVVKRPGAGVRPRVVTGYNEFG
jgi:hypothetical protein